MEVPHLLSSLTNGDPLCSHGATPRVRDLSTSSPTREPLIGIRIRSSRDANILLHPVALGLLPPVTRRLDEAERLQVKSGWVYVWEPNLLRFQRPGDEALHGRCVGPRPLLSVTDSVPAHHYQPRYLL
jgi:hypothetical protein